jgi:hypothetical protein
MQFINACDNLYKPYKPIVAGEALKTCRYENGNFAIKSLKNVILTGF